MRSFSKLELTAIDVRACKSFESIVSEIDEFSGRFSLPASRLPQYFTIAIFGAAANVFISISELTRVIVY